jgi:hypothetical protein
VGAGIALALRQSPMACLMAARRTVRMDGETSTLGGGLDMSKGCFKSHETHENHPGRFRTAGRR